MIGLSALSSPTLAQTESDLINPWALIGDALPAPAQGSDKSSYSVFNPVPLDQMRPFSTDRPGKTHSSLTVDAGHFQLESDFINYTYDRYAQSGQVTHAYSLATPIVKMGVTNWLDLEAAFAFYNHTQVTDRVSGVTQKGSGFGDVYLGGKINVFGNDSGAQSLGLLPFIKIPSAPDGVGNGVIEYTLNAPYTINLDTLWSITLEPALGRLKNSADTGLHGDYSFLVNLNRPLFFKAVTAALELAAEYSDQGQATPRYTLDPSLQWLVAPQLQLDAGAYIGLNKAAPDCTAYTGISFRF
ncbi:MAG: transporter [Pseudomonadota bacterium]|nr:transporter [Pseudomonadota bacterium]